MNYSPSNWYWTPPAGQNAGEVYSSAAGALVPVSNVTYVAWLAAGNAPQRCPVGPDNVTQSWAMLDWVLANADPPMPITGLTPPTQAQLLAYADAKVATLLATPRSYTVSGLSGPIVDDCGDQTGIDMNTTAWALSALTYPYRWSDDNYAVWSMTQAQLTAFLGAAFAYANSVWALANSTAFPGITGGTITTTAQIDALAWPT